MSKLITYDVSVPHGKMTIPLSVVWMPNNYVLPLPNSNLVPEPQQPKIYVGACQRCPGNEEIDHLREWQVTPQLQQREMVVRYQNQKGESRFHGGSQLKQSQSYPLGLLGLDVEVPFWL